MKLDKKDKNIAIILAGTVIFILSIVLYVNKGDEVYTGNNIEEIFVENEGLEEIEVKDKVIDKEKIIVEIKGEVLNPNVYTLEEGSIIKDLIDSAGGTTSEADISNINRAKKLINHELVIIDNINDKEMTQNNGNISKNENSNESYININFADLETLKEIPGIGDVKAQSIISYRESSGGFKSTEEIMNVDGIGEKTFHKIKNMITY